jgi:hypothetical protein
MKNRSLARQKVSGTISTDLIDVRQVLKNINFFLRKKSLKKQQELVQDLAVNQILNNQPLTAFGKIYSELLLVIIGSLFYLDFKPSTNFFELDCRIPL